MSCLCIFNTMSQFYDMYFFGGLLKAQLDFHNISLKIMVGNGSKGDVGSFGIISGDAVIRIQARVFNAVTKENISLLTVNGLTIRNRLDAILIMMEHELLHLGFKTSGIDSEVADELHDHLFKKMALQLFGHTATTHSLISTGGDKKYILSDFKIGTKATIKIKSKVETVGVSKLIERKWSHILNRIIYNCIIFPLLESLRLLLNQQSYINVYHTIYMMKVLFSAKTNGTFKLRFNPISFFSYIKMVIQTRAVNSLETCLSDHAVMYRGIKYRIQDISSEGSLRLLKLVSLTFPRDVTTVLWNPNSTVTASTLVTRRCLITKHVKETTYEVEQGENQTIEIDFGKFGAQIYKWMIEGRTVCTTLHYSFDELHIEAVYVLPKYNKYNTVWVKN